MIEVTFFGCLVTWSCDKSLVHSGIYHMGTRSLTVQQRPLRLPEAQRPPQRKLPGRCDVQCCIGVDFCGVFDVSSAFVGKGFGLIIWP